MHISFIIVEATQFHSYIHTIKHIVRNDEEEEFESESPGMYQLYTMSSIHLACVVAHYLSSYSKYSGSQILASFFIVVKVSVFLIGIATVQAFCSGRQGYSGDTVGWMDMFLIDKYEKELTNKP